ncbi:uncharacterized protein LOC110766760 isoform X2 [Prunus avium]|uniref:RING-type E3 ubiquitin transferase n=1 Tax=Prunus avium TaxID=42229 RepID=A0A6P5TER5_PRUAV|nr:uncharacterized protein LOC110766760 isoform X1 [Prunus avium]XP_021825814.1 uncharacterized protein LOC110766760 isoform X2 [Prunus avium]
MESNSSSSSSAPLHKSRVRVHTILPTRSLLLFFFLFFCINFTNTASHSITQSSDSETLYSKHCNDVVPKSDADPTRWFVTNLSILDIGFRNGYFTGGDQLFKQNLKTSEVDDLKALSFVPSDVGKTLTEGVFKVGATLHLRDYSIFHNSTRRNLRLVYFRGPRSHFRKGLLNFMLDGYYSESSKKLCMVGNGGSGNLRPLSVVLNLNYPQSSSIYDSLITGTLESLSDKHDGDYFEPLLMLGLYQSSSYEYKLAGKDSENGCLRGDDREENLGVGKSKHGLCMLLGNLHESFELEYGSDCGSVNCNPLGGNAGYVSSFVYYGTRCADGRKMQMLLGFPNSSYYGIKFPFDPHTTFITEGAWDEKENRLCAVACRILNFTESLTNAFVGDCSTKFSLRLPTRLSLWNRSTVVGEMWSIKEVNDSGYFTKIGFHTLSGWLMKLLDFQYEYSENDDMRKTCAEKKAGRGKGKIYPDEFSVDMKFGMTVRNSKGQQASGYSSPLFVDDERVYGRRFWDKSPQTESSMQLNQSHTHSSLMNVSYKLFFISGFGFRHDVFPSKAELSAEGIYDRDYGNLCMIGCRHVPVKNQTLIKQDMLDCAIKIIVQFSPLDTKDGQNVKGTIESTRGKLDPLYFEPIEFSSNSIYTSQAAASISRIDFEISMVLISNTLACVFVGLQLLFVKKHPDVLPFVSIVMLIVLSLGYMIPLLVNFEALFVPNKHHSQQDTFLGTGGWLQVNEVIVRVLMMVALLLQLRLLQLTWSSRQGHGNQKSLRDSERKVLYATLPLYIAGALIVWFVNLRKNAYQRSHRPFQRPHRMAYRVSTLHHLAYQQHSLWEDLSSYAGLVLDGFLLPQILFNLFFNSGEKALACAFYFGTTIIRLLPHAYDLYRAQTGTWFLDLSYIYANHKMDFYSTAWNIIIPCGGLLFAAIIFLQQRFGGRFILPKRFRQTSVYEKVPVISNEEL